MQPPRVNLDHLVTLAILAEEASFTAAAARLCLTQSAVSKQLRALETQFGVKLVTTRQKKVHLTPAGEGLLPHAQQVLRAAVAAEAVLRSASPAGTLKLGVASALTLSLLPVVEEYRRENPQIDLTLKEKTSLKLLDELRDGRLDLAIVAASGDVGAGLCVHPLGWGARVTVVVSPDHPLTRLPILRWEDLEPYPLILRPRGSVARNLIVAALDEHGVRPRIVGEVDNIEAASRLVRGSESVALVFMPELPDEAIDRHLTTLQLDTGDLVVGVSAVTRANAPPSPARDALIALLERRLR